MEGGIEKWRFSTNNRFISETIQDTATVAMEENRNSKNSNLLNGATSNDLE